MFRKDREYAVVRMVRVLHFSQEGHAGRFGRCSCVGGEVARYAVFDIPL